MATSASAQSFAKGDGTGNVLSFTYGPGGTKPSSPVVNEQIAVARTAIVNQSAAVRQLAERRFAASATRNLYNSTVVPFAGNADPNSEAPAVTGGGSAGYNEMLKNY